MGEYHRQLVLDGLTEMANHAKPRVAPLIHDFIDIANKFPTVALEELSNVAQDTWKDATAMAVNQGLVDPVAASVPLVCALHAIQSAILTARHAEAQL